MIVAVDPGVNEAGVALFDDGELACAFLSRGPGGWLETAKQVVLDVGGRVPLPQVAELVVETMQVYRQRLLSGDPNDLVDVAMGAGAVAGLLSAVWRDVAVTVYRPAEWKKQVPKRIKNARDVAKLSDEESARVEWPRARADKTHVADAVGIGLHHLKRRS